MKNEKIRKAIRENYGRIASQDSGCCGTSGSCGCGCDNVPGNTGFSTGYSEEQLSAVPEGANLGLGCGNPVAIASLKEGETVLDLGSGAGFDCFLAANAVGEQGKVIGVDMTPEMVATARQKALVNGYGNVEFRLGEIENLPIPDSSIDVIISNCVVNLSPDKQRVFSEAIRVLKPGGRLMISDIVLLHELPDAIRNSMEAYVSCVAGAVMKEEYIKTAEAAGFNDIRIIAETPFSFENTACCSLEADSAEQKAMVKGSVASITISALKK